MMATVRDACEDALTHDWQETRDIAAQVGRRVGNVHRCLSKLMLYGVCERESCPTGTKWRLKA